MADRTKQPRIALFVRASFQLLRTLMEHDLIDVLRLKILPVVLGPGERLFGETSDKKRMGPVDTQSVEGDVALPHLRAAPGRLAVVPSHVRQLA